MSCQSPSFGYRGNQMLLCVGQAIPCRIRHAQRTIRWLLPLWTMRCPYVGRGSEVRARFRLRSWPCLLVASNGSLACSMIAIANKGHREVLAKHFFLALMRLLLYNREQNIIDVWRYRPSKQTASQKSGPGQLICDITRLQNTNKKRNVHGCSKLQPLITYSVIACKI